MCRYVDGAPNPEMEEPGLEDFDASDDLVIW
jgi:hypothetical protein